MKYRKNIRNKLVLSIFLFIIMAVGLVACLLPRSFSSLIAIENVWSGNVATSFDGGNGTRSNPYIISNGEELAYFKSVLEGRDYDLYKDKYYKLSFDINMGGNEFSPIGSSNAFMGHFDGDGHTIANFLVNDVSIYNDEYYSGLFSKLDGATIINLQIVNSVVRVDLPNNSYVGLLSGNMNNTTIKNVSIYDNTIEILSKQSNYIIGGLAGDIKDSNISYLYLNNTISGDNASYNLGYMDSNTNINKVVIKGNQSSISNITVINNGEGNFLNVLNENATNSYSWSMEDTHFTLLRSEVENTDRTSDFSLNSTFTLHDSGKEDGVVYVNDLDADYYYYTGRNYTDASDYKLPSLVDKNIYTENNLVRVKITYNGNSVKAGNNLTASVSLTETENTFIYYKTLVVNDNDTTNIDDDYIDIELIDNPFTNRPDDSGFNGWMTNYTNAYISHDKVLYTRHAKVPVTYENGRPNDIEITFDAVWTRAQIVEADGSFSTSTYNELYSAGMRQYETQETYIEYTYEYIYNYSDIPTDMLYRRYTANSYSSYPSGALNKYGESLTGTCYSWSGCYYYLSAAGTTFNSSYTYYKLVDGEFQAVSKTLPYVIEHAEEKQRDLVLPDDNMSTYFEPVNISYRGSIAGYYDNSGNLITSGTCSSSSGCTYYNLIQYYDNNGNENKFDSNKTYYYLVTRDTNIIVINRNVSVTSKLTTASKPVTITSLNNGVDYAADFKHTGITFGADTTIENVRFYTANSNAKTVPTAYTNNYILYANSKNVKMGRGIRRYNSYVTGRSFISSDKSNSFQKYKVIIESGFYDTLSLSGVYNTSYSKNIQAYGIYGSDYDRVSSTNSLLDVYYCAASSWGNNVNNTDGYNHTFTAFKLVVKSGTFGSRRPTASQDSDQYYSYGIYVGGRNGGVTYAAKEAIIEGGDIYNLIGGPVTSSTQAEYNDVMMYVKGGTIDCINGGAGKTETYGNRIVQVTGGTINYSIFGGSNGVTGSNGEGLLDGKTYIYVGGNAIIGNRTDTLYGAEAGSVFGIGNGRDYISSNNTNYKQIGSTKGTNIIIDGNAIINGNVYGGGNFGGLGLSYSVVTQANILINGGTIKGNVYGGSNKNDSGKTSAKSNVSIEMNDGTVEGAIYGGANYVGITYGSINIKINGGTIGYVYGGGKGGYSGSNTANKGTYVQDDINITIGDNSKEFEPTILNKVYGGSAYGTINSITESTSGTSTKGVQITVNKGIILGSLYGGGQGSSTLTPKVHGPIRIDINNGNIGSVYGANDLAGIPNSSINVYLSGGTIGEVYGGGHKVGINTSTIYQQGSNVTGSIFGGSNQLGDVNKSNIIATDGISGNIYGGNNLDGVTTDANVTFSGGNVLNAIYGGGNVATTGITHVDLSGGSSREVYGGGANADVSESTNINNTGIGFYNNPLATDGLEGLRIFGGSNAGGNIPIAYINNDSTIKIDSIFGGNNHDGKTFKTKINISNGNIDYIFGGGNNVGVDDSDIKLINGEIGNVYGGANEDGNVDNALVRTGEDDSATQDEDDVVEYENIIRQTDTRFNMSVTLTDQWMDSLKQVEISFTNEMPVSIETWDVTILTNDTTLYGNYSSANVYQTGNQYTFNQVNKYYGNNVIQSNGTLQINFLINSVNDGEYPEILSFQIVGIGSDGNEYIYESKKVPKSSSITTEHDLTVNDLYGANNMGGITNNTEIILDFGTYNNIFGGGDKAITNKNSYVRLSNVNVIESVYGGGNDSSLLGNTNIYIGKNSTIGKSVFGGGNHGAIGSPSAILKSKSSVNIYGATIGKNVYGGCNTSTVYGETKVNIGVNAVGAISENEVSDIIINGTIFGGGESNEAGSEIYDFNAISVTEGIDIVIDGTDYDDKTFKIAGSIFGSGNASSSTGTSTILIRKLGTRSKPNAAVSIQRADIVTIDNSSIELTGTTDRTNEYVDYKYSINRVVTFKLKNNSDILLKENANRLESFYSLVDVDGREEIATVEIDTENNTVTKNVDNRLYMFVDKMLNISTDENAENFGLVRGMTFLGMYQKYNNGAFVYGIYDSRYNSGDAASQSDVLDGNTRVVGLHNTNHDITVDGFYTNFIDEDYTYVTTDYINPTPPDSNFYIWAIGSKAINFSILLTASKYSSLGTANLMLLDESLAKGDTIFVITDINTEGLNEGVVLKDSNFVPKLAATQEEADNIMGVSLKTETSEWTNHGTTKFLLENGNSEILGDNQYRTDNQSLSPMLIFYLYHAKNISSNLELGTMVISMQALVPKNEIEVEVYRININVSISTKDYEDDVAYDASITYSKKYDMPSATSVNITNRSQFTSYFSVIDRVNNQSDFYGTNNDYYHALVSDYALPIGTKITMIDSGYDDLNPQYYYMIIDENKYNQTVNMLNTDNEVIYRLSDFIKMDSVSSSNTYNDSASNNIYYHSDIGIVMEEFLFIFDFKDTTNTGEKENNTILFELRNSEDRTEVTVLGIRQNLMHYSLYEESNSVLDATISMENEYVYYDMPKDITNNISISYSQTEGRQSIIDTNYESSNLGINVILYDESGNQITSSQLSSTTLSIDNIPVYVDSYGVFRLKLADKVSNINRTISLTTGNSLPVGNYKMYILLFASNDGLHNSDDTKSVSQELDITVVGSDNLIIVNIPDEEKIIDGIKYVNANGTNQMNMQIDYESVLSNPNIRLSVYKRDVDNYMSSNYTEYDVKNIFINNFETPSDTLIAQNRFEYILTTNPSSSIKYKYTYKGNLVSGTYKFVYRLYDGNQLIDEDFEYVIIKKKIER